MKKGKLIFHIGPPKTATTSLQYFFQTLNSDKIKFCGVYQPRNPLRNKFIIQIYKYILAENVVIDDIKQNIENLLKIYEYVIFSEEVYLVEDPNMAFYKKLERLYSIIGEFNPTIIFCIRNVKECLPSYYQERFIKLPKKYQNDYSLFEKSPHCHCYKYRELEKFLIKTGFNNVNPIFFKKLVKNEYKLYQIFGEERSEMLNVKVNIISSNKGVKIHNRRLAQKKNILEQFLIFLANSLHLSIEYKVYFKKKMGFLIELLPKKVVVIDTCVSDEVILNFNKDLLYFKKKYNR